MKTEFKSYHHWSCLILALLLAVITGCQTTGPRFDARSRHGNDEAADPKISSIVTNRIPEQWLKPSQRPYQLGPGDRLEIEILGKEQSSVATFVCPDGNIYYDLLPGLQVTGMTLSQTKELLERELAQFYKRPQVSLNLTQVESSRVWVLGRLNHAGVYPLDRPTTIIDAIARAGGLFTARFSGTTEELADLNHSFIVRNGQVLPVNFQKLLRGGDTTHNIYLEPDDFIYLPSALSSEVTVLGAVNSPRPVGFVDDMTLSTAVAKAMGTKPDAHLTQVAIVRGSLAEPKIAIIDFKAILRGSAPDVRLSPHDIVYVPSSPYRTLERYAKLITDTFARVSAANEGGRAVSSSFNGIGVSSAVGQ